MTIGCHIGDEDAWMRKQYDSLEESMNYPGPYTEWEAEELANPNKEAEKLYMDIQELQKILQPKSTKSVSRKLSFDDVAEAKPDMNDYSRYMPGREFFKPALNELMKYMSEDDCKAILDHLFKELSKDDRELHISPRVETTIISMMVDRA